jgi:cold shock protein
VATEEPGRERAIPAEDAASAYRSSLRIELDDVRVLADPALDTLPPPPAAASVRSGTALCVVARWNDDEGWGVAEAGDLPGGCWMHFSVVEAPGSRTLRAGQTVVTDWEEREQDGFQYRATRVSLPPAALM